MDRSSCPDFPRWRVGLGRVYHWGSGAQKGTVMLRLGSRSRDIPSLLRAFSAQRPVLCALASVRDQGRSCALATRGARCPKPRFALAQRGKTMAYFGDNLRRLMAAKNLTLNEVARRSGLDVRTVHGILNNPRARPHARTLHKLAQGLAVPVEELFQNPAALSTSAVARGTNPLIQRILKEQPELFDGWESADFHHLVQFSDRYNIQHPPELLQLVNSINRIRQLYPEILTILMSSYGTLFVKVVESFSAIVEKDQEIIP